MKIDREKLTDRTNTFIGRHFVLCSGAVIVGVFVLGWFLLLDNEYQTIRQSGVLGYEDAVERLQSRQTHLFDLQEMEKEWKGLEEDRLAQVYDVLPVGFESTSAMTTIQALAESANLEILSMDMTTQTTDAGNTATDAATSGSAPSGRVRTAVITLNVESKDESDYQDLKYFLDVLQSYAPVMNMQTLNYSPDTTSYALQLLTYYLEPASL